MKQQLPVWSIVAAIAAALIVVALVLFKGPSGEASKEELIKIRQNQRNFSSGAPPVTADASGRGAQRSYADGAPPGGVR
jgi:hypothetical protein